VSDVVTPEKRSQMMAGIRGRGNRGTELALVRLLREHGLTGWRRHYPVMGRPDFVFRRQRIAIFVDGCFWHQCPKCSNMPGNNRDFWEKKLGSNVRRDRLVTATLEDKGWAVVRIWEHELRRPDAVVARIRATLESNSR